MKKIFILTLLTSVLVFSGGLFSSATTAPSDACIYGTAKNKDGSKIDGTATISTSWNNKKAYPKNGEYRLCLGSNPRQKITVYLDGNTYTTISVDGNTRLNITRR